MVVTPKLDEINLSSSEWGTTDILGGKNEKQSRRL